MTRLLLSTLFIIHYTLICAQPTAVGPTTEDAKLRAEIQTLLNGFRGEVGVYVRHLKTGRTVAVNADTTFPTASTIKIPIMIGVFDKIQKGELSYQQELLYRDSLKYDDGVVGSLKDSTKIPLSQVVMLMETVSDNTGSLWLQKLAGTGTAINQWLDGHGFSQTRVNSRTPGREPFRTRYGWGQTTPRELAELLVMIRQGRAVSPAASERMYRNLTRQYWDGDALSQIPPEISVAAKNGAVNRSRSEVVLVHAPNGDYVFCLMTKNQQDESWERTNEGFTLLRNLSALLWRTFEPKSAWKPTAEYEKWW